MTDFSLSPVSTFTFEDLRWDLTPPEGGFVISGTLDVSALTAAQHFPNGYVPSGLVLARRTSDQLLIPYLDAGTGGASTAVGVLRASLPVTRFVGGGNRTKLGVALLVHGVVDTAKLPFTSSNAAAGGYLDANGKVDLPLVYWK